MNKINVNVTLAEQLPNGDYAIRQNPVQLLINSYNINTTLELYQEALLQLPVWSISLDWPVYVLFNNDGSENYQESPYEIDKFLVQPNYYYKYIVYSPFQPPMNTQRPPLIHNVTPNFPNNAVSDNMSNLSSNIHSSEESPRCTKYNEYDDDLQEKQQEFQNTPKSKSMSFNQSLNTTSTTSPMSYTNPMSSNNRTLYEGDEVVVEERNIPFEVLSTITRNAYGRTALIGDQYNAHKDQIYPNNIFSEKYQEDIFVEEYQNKISTNVVVGTSYLEKAKALDIEEELLTSILGDTITSTPQRTTPIQEFLMEKPSNPQDVHVSFVYKEDIQKDVLRDDISNMANRIVDKKQVQSADYFIAGSEWGILMAITFIAQTSNSGENEMKGKINKLLEYLKFVKEMILNENARVVLLDEQRRERFRVKFYTDEVRDYEETLSDVINIFRSEIKRLKGKNKCRGDKTRYILWPMCKLSEVNSNIRLPETPLLSIPTSFLSDMIQQRETFESKFGQMQRIVDFMQNYSEFINEEVIYQAQTAMSKCKKVQSELQSKYGEFIVNTRLGDTKVGSRLVQDIQTAYIFLIQQIELFLGSDMDSFLKKVQYINYLQQNNVHYIGKKMKLEEYIGSLVECYVFFCCWDEVDNSDDGELQYIEKLLKDKKSCFFVDQDLMAKPTFPNQCRVCLFKYGKMHIEDLLNRYIPKNNICIARLGPKRRFVESTRPDNAVQLELCCPRSSGEYRELGCKSVPHFWYCEECLQCFWYFDMHLYCGCGRARAPVFEFKCNDPAHGPNFICFNSETLNKILIQIPPMRDIHILVLGCTGVGKSTWMNGFKNYLTFSSLQDARTSENVTLIPTEFTIYTKMNKRTIEKTIRVGESENEKLSTGASATQFPKDYVFTTRNLRIHLIDTPGIGDTRGPSQDVENFSTIIRYLENYEELHGICILLKPNETRLTLMFKYCVNELLAHLHKDAAKNIMFCFTNTKGTDYLPGETLKLLSTHLEKSLREDKRMDGVKIALNDETVYCFDNESIRFIYAEHEGVQFSKAELEGCEQSWNMSQKVTAKILEHAQALKPHKMRDMLSVNDSRRVINILSGPLANISTTIEKNNALLYAKKEELKNLDTSAGLDNLGNRLFIQQYYIETKDLESPRTVCASRNCTYRQEIGGNMNAMQTFYVQICHDACSLSGIPANQTEVPQLKGCSAFKHDNGEVRSNCKHCGCDFSTHMHITYDEKVNVKFIPAANKKENPKEAIEETIKRCEELIKQNEIEKQIIMDVCIKFSAFLSTHAIMPNNDAYREYLEQQIKEERKLAPESRNINKLNEHERMLAEFNEKERIFNQAQSFAVDSNYVVEPKHIQEALCTLFALPNMGGNIKAIHDKASEAQVKEFDSSKKMVEPLKVNALAIEEAKRNADWADTVFGQHALAPEEMPQEYIVNPIKAVKKKQKKGMFSWIVGVVEQVGSYLGYHRASNDIASYPQEEAANKQQYNMPERKGSIQSQMSRISNETSYSISSNNSNTGMAEINMGATSPMNTPQPYPVPHQHNMGVNYPVNAPQPHIMPQQPTQPYMQITPPQHQQFIMQGMHQNNPHTPEFMYPPYQNTPYNSANYRETGAEMFQASNSTPNNNHHILAGIQNTNIDMVIKQLKGVALQTSTSHTGKLPTVNLTPNQENKDPTNDQIPTRVTNYHGQQFIPNYPDPMTGNIFSPQTPTPDIYGQTNQLNFGQNIGAGTTNPNPYYQNNPQHRFNYPK